MPSGTEGRRNFPGPSRQSPTSRRSSDRPTMSSYPRAISTNCSRRVNRAMQLFFSASLFSARELLEWGLINEVVPAPQLLTRAKDIALQFSRQSPEVLAQIKDLARAYFNTHGYDGYRANRCLHQAHWRQGPRRGPGGVLRQAPTAILKRRNYGRRCASSFPCADRDGAPFSSAVVVIIAHKLAGSLYSVKVTTKNALGGLAKPQRVARIFSNGIATAWPIPIGQCPTNDRAADER